MSPQFPDARTAWDGQKGRHFDRPPLGIAVPIWFDHWGNYGTPPTFKNWGHVATRLPDGRVLSSPFWPKTYGYDIFPDIDSMMKALGGNAKYLGWSEWLHDTQIVSYREDEKPSTPESGQEEDEEMKNIGFWYYTDKSKKTISYMLVNFGSGFVSEYGNGTGNGPMSGAYNNPIAAAAGTGSYAQITESHARALKASLADVRKGK